MADDNVQHGIDDDPNNDAEKGATLGGLGGAAVGAAAGAAAGPVGAVVGAVIGGLAGAGASGMAVAAVDSVDNDNTVSGVGSGATGDVAGNSSSTLSGDDIVGDPVVTPSRDAGGASANAVYPSPSIGATAASPPVVTDADVSDMNIDRGIGNDVPNVRNDIGTIGNDVPGVQTGGVTTAGPDTRGITEKSADTLTGDRTDDKTGGRVI